MTTHGSDVPPAPDLGAPGGEPMSPQPGRPWTPPAGYQPVQPGYPAPQPARSGAKKWLRVGGSVAVAAVVGIGSTTGWFGMTDPKVGDCVKMKGETDFDVVDCASADAEYKIVGIDKKQRTWGEMNSDDTVCAAFQTWEVALWVGDDETEPGKIYCSEPV